MEPHLCPICHRTFSRKEHLRRHLLSHTDLRQFVCRNCGKAFNRRDAFRRHADTCRLSNQNEANFSERVVRKPLGQVSGLEENHDHVSCADQHGHLSLEPLSDHMICQLESNSYRESIRDGASQSLSIFVRTITKFELNWVFDPEFTLPASPSPCTTSFSDAQASQMPTRGLPSSVTMMDAGDATASCIWPWSSVTMMDAGDTAASCIWPWSSVTTMDPGDTAVSCVWPWSSDFNNENSPCAYGSLNLDHESARIEAIQPTPYLAEASKTWTPSPGHLWSTGYNDYLTVSNEIMSRLRNEICHKRSGQAMYPHGWSSQIENECFALFGPNSLMKFTEEYWSTWYIHWPAIHRATFRISQAPPALVASMVLLATSYSPDVHTRELARRWGDAVEAIVFTDEHFGSATLFSTLNAACLERRLRALQAGLAICVYQTFEGSAVASRKARRSRFNDIVDMGRELGFQNGQHTDLQNVTHDTFCWKEFILKEELIRTLTSIIILDSSFSIIYNTVPKVMVEEVQTDLFCPEACFQASTESECLQHLVAWVSHPLRKGRRISFADALKILSATQLDSQTQQMFTQFGELNLFVLTAALHSIIFHIRNSIVPFDPNSAVLNIMRNWRRIWTLRELMRPRETFGIPTQSTGDESARGERWRQTGFMKDPLQFWLLGQIMLDSKRSGNPNNGLKTGNNPPNQFDQPCMSNLKQYLSKAGRGYE